MPPPDHPAEDALPLTRWERALGTVFGCERRELPAANHQAPREALSEAILPALARTPCLVSFSGGLDSSVALAVATHIAREHRMAEPVPVTLRFPDHAAAEESTWQELVVASLGLSDWVRLEVGDELDFLGEMARASLARHGLLRPANAHFHVPVLAHATGGSVLTGLDGDGLFGGWRWREARQALRRRHGLQPRDLLRVSLAAAPEPVRAAGLFARLRMHAPWLRPTALPIARARLARAAAQEPFRWDARVNWYAGLRYLRLGTHSLGLLAAARDVQLTHPLLDARFLASVAGRGGRDGYDGRGGAIRALFADLLPAELLARRTKAEFGAALWGAAARDFARTWDGGGVDLELIDTEALATTWRQPNPPLAAATLLQQAWLARIVGVNA